MDQNQSQARRLVLHQRLIDVSGLPKTNVYFQPPPSITLAYPCIVYELAGYNTESSNNLKYISRRRYKLVLMHRDPDNHILDDLLAMPMTSFSTSFIVNNVHHYNLETYI